MRRTGLIMKLAMVAIIAFLIVLILRVYNRRQEIRAEEIRLREEIAKTAANVDTLKHFVANPEDPDVIEYIARKYGFIYRNEQQISGTVD